ncbi:type II glyceraldehyde-3-phosphate dehydrogenase [Thermoproteus tenax]|uniref:Glyceraldehyde-3-phosphate dehydrogenase n=1 Tax=Thermoproteus tenax (strain ATCC 35583 / DSM 2078 / JCM 9277 / NBRC 100435 / Kra 1) TaxID=768679 RepID=G4RKR5_THETK|nr:type II glyceraldehyde-3-phosphate dehydrogenase [Thermoproteus tenax]CCC82160.1 glyceraldehyde-3-phosphate dehydrogenase (NADP-dependent) [Thermoproteus tenax Kra 1]
MKVAIVGYGTIGKRVADAVSRQDDMTLVGIYKVTPDYEAVAAAQKGYRVFAPREKADAFKKIGVEVEGDLNDLASRADVIVDATPDGVGAQNKELYVKLGKNAIFQGGEEADVAEVSFNALGNYEKALGKRYIRVVSCNTTSITRVLSSLLLNGYKIRRARVFITRRGADPKEHKKGPINDVVPNPATVPSHHGPDVQTVLEGIDIVTLAVAVPVTIMHMHMAYIELDEAPSKDAVMEALATTPRILLFETKKGYSSLAQIIEWARDIGRPRGDVWEVSVLQDSVTVRGNELYLMYGVHQEAVVVPENIDAIRAMYRLADKWSSIEKTDKSLGIVTHGKKYNR